MRKLFLMAALLICLTGVNSFRSGDASRRRKRRLKPSSRRAQSIELLEEAKKRGEIVLGSCLDNVVRTKRSSEDVEVGHVIEMPKPTYPPIARERTHLVLSRCRVIDRL